jgi:hypothetical protein
MVIPPNRPYIDADGVTRMRPVPIMVWRVEAVEATIARFAGKPLVYGTHDCIRMGSFCLRKLGVKTPLLKAGSYSSELGAARAMKRMGYDTVEDAVGLPRIPPAAAVAGDILALPGEGGSSICVAVGNGRALAFWMGQCQVAQPLQYVTAWRSIDAILSEGDS